MNEGEDADLMYRHIHRAAVFLKLIRGMNISYLLAAKTAAAQKVSEG
jgi:hypothetical protein